MLVLRVITNLALSVPELLQPILKLALLVSMEVAATPVLLVTTRMVHPVLEPVHPTLSPVQPVPEEVPLGIVWLVTTEPERPALELEQPIHKVVTPAEIPSLVLTNVKRVTTRLEPLVRELQRTHRLAQLAEMVEPPELMIVEPEANKPVPLVMEQVPPILKLALLVLREPLGLVVPEIKESDPPALVPPPRTLKVVLVVTVEALLTIVVPVATERVRRVPELVLRTHNPVPLAETARRPTLAPL